MALAVSGCAAILGIDDVDQSDGASGAGGQGASGGGTGGRGGGQPGGRGGAGGVDPKAGQGGTGGAQAGSGGSTPEAGRGGAAGLGGTGGVGGVGGVGGPLPPPKVIINEISYNPPLNDADGHCFIELLGAPGAPLEGLELVQVTNAGLKKQVFLFDGSHSLGSSGYFLLIQSDKVTVPEGVNFAVDDDGQGSSPDLINTENALVLRRNGDVIDAVAYSNKVGECPPKDLAPGEGECARATGPAIDDEPWSLSRTPNGTDTDQNSLNFAVCPPTSGAANAPPILK